MDSSRIVSSYSLPPTPPVTPPTVYPALVAHPPSPPTPPTPPRPAIVPGQIMWLPEFNSIPEHKRMGPAGMYRHHVIVRRVPACPSNPIDILTLGSWSLRANPKGHLSQADPEDHLHLCPDMEKCRKDCKKENLHLEHAMKCAPEKTYVTRPWGENWYRVNRVAAGVLQKPWWGNGQVMVLDAESLRKVEKRVDTRRGYTRY